MSHSQALIAMSGGVDSAVAAWLMIQEGFSCVGATMELFKKDTTDTEDAAAVAQRLGMPFHVLDLSREFTRDVIENFIGCYEKGLTPNPCIVCNRCLKFGALLDCARNLGCDTLVTGHYARIRRDAESGRWLLYKALDDSKDQSYVLYTLTQDQLSHARFPLGEMTKAQAREIAEAQGFVNAHKQDSQDICFIPDGDYVAFMERYTGKTYESGDFLDLDGRVVGRHRGAVCYTLGQRKGLGLAMGAPVYVCAKDMQENTVTVGPNEALFTTTLRANDWNWFPFETLTTPIEVMAKARYRHIPQPATVYPEENGFCRVEFHEPQRALTPGQAVVLYQGELVVGGGTITEVL